MAVHPPDLDAEKREAGDHHDHYSDNDVAETGNGCLQPLQAFIGKRIDGRFSHNHGPFTVMAGTALWGNIGAAGRPRRDRAPVTLPLLPRLAGFHTPTSLRPRRRLSETKRK